MTSHRESVHRGDSAGSVAGRDHALVTRIADHRPDGVEVRGRSLETELIGHVGYADMIMLGALGHLPDPEQRQLLDACLVALMEGGLNPSTLVTRMVAMTAPDQAQAAMAAGLLTVGDVYVGSVQECAALLEVIGSNREPRQAAARGLAELRSRGEAVPGLGHGRHDSEDPRATAILRLATAEGVGGIHCAALDTLQGAARKYTGRALVINVTGAVAAVLLDLGFPVEATRPIALAARAGGLVAHLVEESCQSTAKQLWIEARRRVPYRQHDPTDPTDERKEAGAP